jgi:hypothetical protein
MSPRPHAPFIATPPDAGLQLHLVCKCVFRVLEARP